MPGIGGLSHLARAASVSVTSARATLLAVIITHMGEPPSERLHKCPACHLSIAN